MMTIGSITKSTSPKTDVSHGPRSGLRNRVRSLAGDPWPGSGSRTALKYRSRRSQIRDHPAADESNTGERQTDLTGQRGGAVHADRCPAEPRPDVSSRLQTHPVGTDADGFGVELGHTAPAAAQQFGSPTQNPSRVAPEADVAVDQQYRLPVAHPGKRLEHIAEQGRSAAATGQSDRGRRPVDAKGGYPPLDEPRDQPCGSASELDRRRTAHLRDGLIKRLNVGAIAQPTVSRQRTDFTVLIADPTSLAAKRPIVEVPQHVKPLAALPTRRP